ncbi:hypothetical protein GGR56DRAFT_637242 [Xylariaceae sp. FL0804]|nr:hypothetical protein GGR56DRAFT_637242 [Xylariaceae sp. FL0804]
MAPVTVSVVYPMGTKFDMDYYLSTHSKSAVTPTARPQRNTYRYPYLPGYGSNVGFSFLTIGAPVRARLTTTTVPLVQKTWASVGLRNWKVVHYTDPSATYCVQALLDWDSAEAWEKAAGSSEGATVFGDIDNFSDQKPQTLVGEIKGAQTC